jgi:hypothetical protein
MSAFKNSLAASGLFCTGNCDTQRPKSQAFVKTWSVVSSGGQFSWSSHPGRLVDQEPGSDYGRSLALGDRLLAVGAPLSAASDRFPSDGVDRPGLVYLYRLDPACTVKPCGWVVAASMQERGALGYGQALSLGPQYLSVSGAARTRCRVSVRIGVCAHPWSDTLEAYALSSVCAHCGIRP